MILPWLRKNCTCALYLRSQSTPKHGYKCLFEWSRCLKCGPGTTKKARLTCQEPSEVLVKKAWFRAVKAASQGRGSSHSSLGRWVAEDA